MRWNLVWQKRPYLPLIGILLLAFGLRLHALDSQSLWWDELKTVQRATMTLPDLLADLTRNRAHLPFYFLLMRGWSLFMGNSAFSVRYFSVLWGVLGVTAVFQLGKQLATPQVGPSAAFLLAISPFHIWYSQEARMYSFLPTLLILAHVALVAVLKKSSKRYWLLYFLAMGTAVFTHYFTFLILLAHAIFAILNMRLKPQFARRWFGQMAVLAALFAPWAYKIASQHGYNEAVPPWINAVHWYEPFLTLWTFSVGPSLGWKWFPDFVIYALFLLGFCLGLKHIHNHSRQQNGTSQLLLLWLGLPLLLILGISLSGAFSLYVDRYLIIVLPIYLLLVAFGWVSLFGKERIAWLLGIVALVTAVSLINLVPLYTNPASARNDWRQTFAVINQNSQPTDQIIGIRDVELPFEFYGLPTLTFLELPPAEAADVTPAFAQVMTQRIMETAVATNRFWFIEAFYVQDAHNNPTDRNMQVAALPKSAHHQWLQANLAQKQLWRFPGVRLTLYERDE